MNKEVSFWSFLKTHRIEIPIIQRDYAQGRQGEKYSFLRKKFLEDIKNAILKVPPYQEKPLSLDFVYGTEKNGSLLPLDGQQRLTTLWLLHWYIAYKAGKINEAEDILKKFVYKTRKFSSEFCRELSSFSEPQKPDVGIVAHIKNWINISEDGKQDPTFQAMLRMLGGTKIDDGIEGVFKDVEYEYCWTRLTEEAPVVFYYLPLEDFGLSDNLYIKMNARGKPLTPFESLKADLIDYLYKQKDLWEKANGKNKKNPWSNLLDPTEGMPVKLDTTWTKIFWKHHWKDGRIDEIYFAFLNRFFWNELFIATKTPKAEGSPIDYFLAGDLQGLDEKDTGEDKDPYHRCYRYLNTSESRGEYRSLDSYKFCKMGDDSMEISPKLFENLNKVLSNYLKYMDAPYEIPSNKWVGNFRFIPKYDNSGNLIEILKPQRVIFFALCKYFMEEDESNPPDYNALWDWIRVVCNLVSGRISNKPGDHLQIRNNNEARMVIKYIDDYLCSHDVYNTQKWKVDKDADPFSFEGKCYEEYIKAKKIFEDRKNSGKDQWEDKIITAEGHSFFNGTIRFLYQGKGGEEDWDNFDTKWKNVNELYFNEGTSFLRNEGTITLRVLIKQFEKPDFERVLIWGVEGKKKRDAENNKNKMILGNGVAAWRSYLINPCLSAPVHKFLTINDKISDTIEEMEGQPCPGKEDEVKYALYLLTKTKLLDRVIKVFEESGLRYENEHLVIRKFGSNEFTRGGQHIILYTKKYDFLLQTNVTREQFYKNYKIDLKIPNTNLHFECANICFSYEGYNFILYRNDNLIYLQPGVPEGWEGVPIKGTNAEYHFERTIDDVAADWANDEGEAKEEKIKNFLSKLKELGDKARADGHDEV